MLTNKIAVITGAGSGLGASLAKKYSNDGFSYLFIRKNER